jgi:hypothetical protein
LTGIAFVLFLVAGGTVPLPDRAAAAPQTNALNYVKYYVVEASYQGKPEDLDEIATRFMGTSARAQDIFDLNANRTQRDGGKLTDPKQLHGGWNLIMPWDAVGPEVHYGLLPAASPKPPPATPAAPAQPAAGTAPIQAAAPNPPASHAAEVCAGTSRGSTGSQTQWATLRLAPDHAWTYTRGAGELVAVVDSGVDASLPALSGRVTVGADIVSGSGRGDTDCLGTGTVMASIIAAQSDQGGGVSGIAPDATILPVRLATTDPDPKPADQASAIQFAVSAGARVIALGSYLTPDNPVVAAAIRQASDHDVVVVTGAPTGPSQPAPPSPATPAPVLRVGGVGIDAKPTAQYSPDTVDVVAPGTEVAGLGINGTGEVDASGTQYAVAFVAAQVALVRARYPKLTAAQVIHRIEVTADRIGANAPDPRYGWGLIDPGVSVTQVIAEESQPAGVATTPHGAGLPRRPRMVALLTILVVLLVAAILLVLRLRRAIRPLAVGPQPPGGAGDDPGPTAAAADAVVTRIGAGPAPSTVDAEQPAAAGPAPLRSDNAASARGTRGAGASRTATVELDATVSLRPDLLTEERSSGDDA